MVSRRILAILETFRQISSSIAKVRCGVFRIVGMPERYRVPGQCLNTAGAARPGRAGALMASLYQHCRAIA